MNPSTRETARVSNVAGLALLGIVTLGCPSVRANSAMTPVASPSPNDNFSGQLSIQDGKMTARVHAMPLGRVIAELCKVSGAVASLGISDEQKPVSVEFSQVPLSIALVKLLGGNNFVFFNPSAKETGQLPRIWIYPQEQLPSRLVNSQEAKTAQTGLHDAVPGIDLPPTEKDIVALLDAAVYSDENSARLQAVDQLFAFAQNNASAERLLTEVAISDKDPQVRKAVEELLQHLQYKK